MGRVIVIGSGLAGLSTAIRLGSAGHQVLVFERAEEPGGSLTRIRLGEDYFDAEPGCVLLPQLLADLFAAAGERLDDSIDFLPVQPAYRFVSPEGERFDFWTDRERLRDEIGRLSPDDAPRFERFFRYSRHAFHALSRGVWRRPLTRKSDLWLGLLFPASLLRSPWLFDPRRAATIARGRWHHPLLRRAFAHLTAELGSSAHHAPAAALWNAHAQWKFGAWYPRGGMWGLRRALLRVADRAGVQIRCGESVGEIVIQAGSARGVVTQEGRSIEAHAVINSADPVSLSRFLIQKTSPSLERFRRRWERRDPSFTRFAYLWSCSRDWPVLAHQTVFLSEDAHTEYQHLRDWQVPAPEPTLTVVHPARTDRDLGRRNRAALTAWLPLPGLSARWRWNDDQRLAARDAAIARLQGLGLDDLSASIEAERELPPSDWRDEYGCYRGIGWGPAAHSLRSLLARYPNRHPLISRLYFVNRWTHPGPTTPQILIGSRLVSQLVAHDLQKPS